MSLKIGTRLKFNVGESFVFFSNEGSFSGQVHFSKDCVLFLRENEPYRIWFGRPVLIDVEIVNRALELFFGAGYEAGNHNRNRVGHGYFLDIRKSDGAVSERK